LFILLLLAAGLGMKPALQNTSEVDPVWKPLNRFPRMVQEFFVSRISQLETEADRRRAALSTRADAEAYVQAIRTKIQQSFGPWPEKTPLKPRITGIVEREDYKIEKILFESRPNFLVTANLYVPKGRDFPLPGVVGSCGHSSNGKAAEAYQSFAQGLARQGYVVLLYDPIGQGERLQYTNDRLESEVGVGVREHIYAGNQQFLVGEFFGSWRAWDGIRALDYLLTREEVDPAHVGVTGNSGGGTMTTWLAGIDRRWTMAAPGCFVTTFRRNLENELPADTEQCPPRVLALGLDHSDWLAAMAPNPVIILAKERDYFDVRGSEEAYRRLRHLYGLLGAEQNVGLFVGPTSHGYSQENREAMYRWFNQITAVSDAATEPELVLEKDETLRVTPNGQVSALNSQPIYEFTASRSRFLARERPANLTSSQLQQRAREVLRLSEMENLSSPYYRILRNWSARGYPKPRWTTYLVETEPGISAVVYRLGSEPLLSRPHAESKRAVLYVANVSSDAELREEPLLAEWIESDPDTIFFTVDVRGIGETRPDTSNENSFFDPYGSDYFYASHSIMLDRPYVGQRTQDVLRVLDWLGSIGHEDIHLVGKGWGAVPATFAAILSDRVQQVTLKNAPTSYAEIAESRTYDWPLAVLVPGILASFDLPDCYRVLKSKDLRQIEPRGPMAGLF
jgi:cephalosporin-C deacetylase-like acetyl esterase